MLKDILWTTLFEGIIIFTILSKLNKIWKILLYKNSFNVFNQLKGF